jgi:phosphatidylinositol glycan class H protein
MAEPIPLPHCTLRIQKPTSTTVSFTVSTRTPHNSITSLIIHYTLILLRLLLALQILVVLYIQWAVFSSSPTLINAPLWLLTSPPFSVGFILNAGVPLYYVVPVGVIGLWVLARRGYTEESLLVLRGLGVQTTSSSSTYLSTASTRFIPTTAIQDIFIHEAFKGFEVRFYLAIVVEGEQEVVVVFPVSELLLRLRGANVVESSSWKGHVGGCLARNASMSV